MDMEPPGACGTPLTVSTGVVVSCSQMSLPSADEKARSQPSLPPWNTAPGIDVGAAEKPAEQRPDGTPHGLPWGESNLHTSLPSATLTATSPGLPRAGGSFSGANTSLPSVA